MKRFIVKCFLFLLPFIILHIYTFSYYTTNQGDLIRLGYIVDLFPNYRNSFTMEFQQSIEFNKVSEHPKKKKYDVLTLGDSFSEQNNFGYQNYLSKKGLDVLHFDRKIHKKNHPIQTAFSILNGGFFEEYKINYLVLELVEREFVPREPIKTGEIISNNEIDFRIKRGGGDLRYEKFEFPSDVVLKFPYYSFLYFNKGDYLFYKTYRVQTEKKLFTIDKNELLFYYLDKKAIVLNNNIKKLESTNKLLNELSERLHEKGIELLVLPAPDKLDFYFEFIVNKQEYEKPLFFELMDQAEKQYKYINTKALLNKKSKQKKDIYFYDDTHWSPYSSMIVANELNGIITEP